MSLAQRIRQLRYDKGWGTHDLAARAQVSRTALYHIESGKTTQPRASTLNRIAQVLGVSLEALINDTQEQPATHPPPESGHGPETDTAQPIWLRDFELEYMFRTLLNSRLRESIASIVQHTFRILTKQETQPNGTPSGDENPNRFHS